jgi:membrane-associated phospholipid phosphatase
MRREGSLEVADLQGRIVNLFGLGLKATDGVVIGSVLLFDLLIFIFHERIPDPWKLLGRNSLIGILFIAAVWLYPRLVNRPLKFVVRTGSVQLAFASLYVISLRMQLIFVRAWQDPSILSLEESVFGVQPTVWVQKFFSPPLTEWMMFSYTIYLVIYPLLSGVIFFKRGERQLEDYLVTLAIANITCFLGFMIYPVAGPLDHMPQAYDVPLKGWFFTAWGEYIRTHVHEIGGTIPSPHCAVATVMWAMTHRYVRPAFYALAPVMLSLYASTVYARYHYLTDSLIGIAVGVFAIIIAPALVKGWNTAAGTGRKGKP